MGIAIVVVLLLMCFVLFFAFLHLIRVRYHVRSAGRVRGRALIA